jgi:hypothetical protein
MEGRDSTSAIDQCGPRVLATPRVRDLRRPRSTASQPSGGVGALAVAWLTLVLGVVLGTPVPGIAADHDRGMGTPPTRSEPAPPTTVLDAARESLFGDVYVEPTRWRELPFSTFFTEGWDEPWASPVTGAGGAPRQGWLNAADGVFYRLVIGTFGYSNDLAENGDGYDGGATLYTPLSRRFELRWDVPFVTSNRDASGDRNTSFGDFQVTPRFMLSETQALTQSFNVTFRTPTGDIDTGTSVAAVTPAYEFWANWWQGLVVRGGASMFLPYNHTGTREVGSRTSFLGNLAAGYYFTQHDLTPVGDLVGYVAANLTQLTDNRGPSTTTLTFTPGFRTHMGANWYLLGGVELPATQPEPFAYKILGGLMKVF